MGLSTIVLAVMLASPGPSLQDDGDVETGAAARASGADAQAAASSPPVPSGSGTAPPVEHAPADATPAPPAEASAEATNDIIVHANPRHVRADPMSGINAATFDAVNAVDKAVVGPVAGNYEKIVPTPVRNGLRNVLINLAEPTVFLNYLLQFKPGKALETVGRFGINSTIGIAGLFDIARRKPFHLPYRQNGFANSLAYHGVGNGPYLFLPIIGPTTVRDLVGRVGDVAVVPITVGSPFNKPVYSISTSVVKALNDRVAFDEEIVANRAKADPYVATRNFYLKRRQAEIDALHSPEYRARKGIPDPVLPPIPPHVNDNAAPGSAAAQPTVSVPSSTGMAPAAPAPKEPVSGTPAVTPD